MVLKGVPPCLSPDLLHVLASMGHADRIVLADTNFPTASICGEGTEGPRQVRADGHSIPVLLEAILQLLPLDTYVYAPVMLMDLVNKDKNSGMPEPPVWATYQGLLDSSEGKKVEVTRLERFEFYKQAKEAYAVVHTGETALYGNIILQKGVLRT